MFMIIFNDYVLLFFEHMSFCLYHKYCAVTNTRVIYIYIYNFLHKPALMSQNTVFIFDNARFTAAMVLHQKYVLNMKRFCMLPYTLVAIIGGNNCVQISGGLKVMRPFK